MTKKSECNDELICIFIRRQSWTEEEENMTALVYRMDDSLKAYRDDVMKIGGDFTTKDCLGSSWTWASE